MSQHVLNCSYKDLIRSFSDYEIYKVVFKTALLDSSLKEEFKYWETVQKNNSRSAYEHYIETYPNGAFARIAYEKIIELIEEAKVSYAKVVQKEKLKSLLSWINHPAGSYSSFSYNHSDYEGEPRNIEELEDLVSLEIRDFGTGITEISEHIGLLTNLKKLCINCTGKEIEIPDSIGSLLGLTELEMKFRNLTEIPQSIGNLVNLKKLSINNISGCYLIENPNIPPDHCYNFIRNLKKLEHLEIIATHFTNLPESIRKLSNLTTLDISRNRMEALPEWIGDLINLKILYINDNNLKSLPKSMKKLTNITYLRLDNNNLLSMPKLFFQIRSMDLWHATSYSLSYSLK